LVEKTIRDGSVVWVMLDFLVLTELTTI